MPASREALQLTDAYRSRLLQLRQGMGRALRSQWQNVDLADLDRSYAAWLAAAAPAVEATQTAGVSLTGAYLTRYLTAELGRREQAPAPDPERFAGRDKFDRELKRALAPPLYTVKLAIAHRQPADVALQAGLMRALRIGASAAAAAPREALTEAIADDDRIAGWRRATSGNPCGACLAAATGAIRADDEIIEAHDHCQCVAEPVVRGVRERVHRPTGEELFDSMTTEQQDALFAGRGGAAKAELIRSGVPLERLIARQPEQLGAGVITEAPLGALTT